MKAVVYRGPHDVRVGDVPATGIERPADARPGATVEPDVVP
jgi:hypothetical protein